MGRVAIGMEPGKFLWGWGGRETIISKIIESLCVYLKKFSEKLHYEQEVN